MDINNRVSLLTKLTALSLLISTGLLVNQFAFSEKGSDDGKKVEEYLMQNPKVVIGAIEKYQQQKQAEQLDQAKRSLAEKTGELFGNTDDPRVGSNDAKIKIVEFFDYSCGYCKKMSAVKRQLLAENADIQIIFKEMPILGEPSYKLAHASMAAYIAAPDKYFAFQQALMGGTADTSEANMVGIAKNVGIDESAFKKAYQDEGRIKAIFQKNMKLAYELGLRGTPAYVIGNELIPGYVSYEELKKQIEQARK